MTAEQLAFLAGERVPTPAEFAAFVRDNGLDFVELPSGEAFIVPALDDPLSVALARVLAREPYRTGVLEALHAESAAPGLCPPAGPKGETFPGRRRREWLFRSGAVVAEPAPVPVSCPALPSGLRWDWAGDYDPFGAPWRRFAGEPRWEPVPGRDCSRPPRGAAVAPGGGLAGGGAGGPG